MLAQGYAISFAERSSGVVAIAAPIMDADGAVIASLSIAGPASRINADNLQGFIDLVVQRARPVAGPGIRLPLKQRGKRSFSHLVLQAGVEGLPEIAVFHA